MSELAILQKFEIFLPAVPLGFVKVLIKRLSSIQSFKRISLNHSTSTHSKFPKMLFCTSSFFQVENIFAVLFAMLMPKCAGSH